MLMTAFRQALPFHETILIPGRLSFGDLLFAGVLAYLLTRVIAVLTPKRGETDLTALPEAARAVMERCYQLFPIETVQFGGETFTRGMMVRVTTRARQTFEGRLLGLNDDEIICVLTKRKIAADLLANVAEIVKMESITP